MTAPRPPVGPPPDAPPPAPVPAEEAPAVPTLGSRTIEDLGEFFAPQPPKHREMRRPGNRPNYPGGFIP